MSVAVTVAVDGYESVSRLSDVDVDVNVDVECVIVVILSSDEDHKNHFRISKPSNNRLNQSGGWIDRSWTNTYLGNTCLQDTSLTPKSINVSNGELT
jgi:hypothetical protein